MLVSITDEELLEIDGGKIDGPGDMLIMIGGIAACFISPWIGVPITVAVALL